MEKYKFKKYDEKFPELFRKEKLKLRKILMKDTKIEHIGSSAVPELGGKGIIDIIISVPRRDIKKVKDALNEFDYHFKPKAGNKNRLFFEKDYKNKGKIRRVHLHLTSNDSILWKEAIAVRNYLKENEKEKEEYSKLKKEAVKICRGEGKTYRNHKNKFLNELTKKALNKK